MTHGYSLRSNAKGCREHRSTDETDDQAEGTSNSTSTNSTDEELDGESGIVDPRPTSPATPRAAHNSRAPTQDSKPQTMEEYEDQQRHSRSIITTLMSSSVVEGRRRRPEEPWEEIQAARKREEARRIAEAVRIRRTQVVRGYEEELRALRARIVALRSECEVRVEKVRKKWELDWAIERGEVAVVVDEGVSSSPSMVVVGLDSNSNSNWEDADGAMEMAVDNAPTETTSSCWSRSKSNFLPSAPAPAPVRRTQQHWQQPRMGPQGTFPSSGMGMGMQVLMESSQLQAGTTATEKKHDDDNNNERGQWPGEAHTGTSTSRRRRFPTLNHHPSQGRSSQPHHLHPQPQPLRRQQRQLFMGTPTGTSEPSHGLDM